MPFILQTKLNKPELSRRLIERPILLKLLDSGLSRKLVLISAPAGYGKTTLIARWLAGKKNFAWFSIDKSDNDDLHFLNYLLTAVGRYDPGIVHSSLQILRSQTQNPPREYILGELINNLMIIRGELVIVLDDYHLINNSTIHKMLAFFLENMPSNVHLVMGTRSDPPILLARLRSLDQVVDIRINRLCFTKSETGAFFNQLMGLPIANSELEMLDARVEGWVAGLQMAAITLKGVDNIPGFIRNLALNNQFFLDYLVEEIYQQLPESIRQFLLKTSILSRFNVSLCNYLLDSSNAEKSLSVLIHSNLFVVPLDHERNWYRYHHLFGDLLRQRLLRSTDITVDDLHIRAGKWFETEGEPHNAIHHFLKASAYDQAERLMCKIAEPLWMKGESRMLLQWTHRFPEGKTFRSELSVVLGAIALLNGQYEKAKAYADNAAEWVSKSSQKDISGKISALRAYLYNYLGQVALSEKYGRQALAELSDGQAIWRCLASMALGDIHVQRGGALSLAAAAYEEAVRTASMAGGNYCLSLAQHRLVVMYFRLGQIHKAERQVLQFNGLKDEGLIVSGALFLIMGEIKYELNRLNEAESMFRKALDLCRQQGHAAAPPYCLMYIAKTRYAKGDMQGAGKYTDESVDSLKNANMPAWVVGFVYAWHLQWLVLTKQYKKAREVAEFRNLHLASRFHYPNETEYLAYAHLLLRSGEPDAAKSMLESLIAWLDKIHWVEIAVKARFLRVHTLFLLGDTKDAVSGLEKLLSMARPEKYIRSFMDYGEEAGSLLDLARQHRVESQYAAELLALLDEGKSEFLVSKSTALCGELSCRELEVLRLLKFRHSNAEIAHKLCISVNTVKTHVKKIYGKLGAHNRKKAVETARLLSLI